MMVLVVEVGEGEGLPCECQPHQFGYFLFKSFLHSLFQVCQKAVQVLVTVDEEFAISQVCRWLSN